MKDEDIYAFSSPPTAAAVPKKHRLWPWLLGGSLMFVTLMLLVMTLLAAGLSEAIGEGWHVVVNGNEWDGLDIHVLHGAGALLGTGIGLTVALLVLLLLLFLVVPAVVLLALLAAGLGVGVALCAVVLAGALVAAVFLAPLWLLWLLVRALRHKPARAGATMNA
jgi:hypothetical protein